ncbi:MAG TPA: acylphosphatase [Stellaceae bacterium]|nr:acylphosphatase [Stellaceae bacterium]
MAEIAVRMTVEGRVQGVGYRVWAVGEATRLGLRGWVRNRRDGSVEALLIGAPDSVDAMVEACRHGPRAARVARLSRESATDDGTQGFHERATV